VREEEEPDVEDEEADKDDLTLMAGREDLCGRSRSSAPASRQVWRLERR